MNDADELAGAKWRKASFSGSSGGCVELAKLSTGGAARDSKNPEGGALRTGIEGMRGLILSAKSGVLRP
ncbi:DUF397 domain-containing protein [Amycolatopsis sp. cmx-4-61]|uniref:DUF397 domain-containing protein n=1 Tax=Amycolatopsis sp. cmx-4-61 TaxID=2790937 RepID=UPI00397E2B7D